MARISVVIPVAPGRGAEIVDSLKDGEFKDYLVIVKEGLNPSRNRNLGIAEAKGEIVAILDDDAYAEQHLLERAWEFFKENPDVDIVGGPQLSPPGESWFARVSGYAIASFFGSFSMSKRYGSGRLELDAGENSLTSANLFIRRKSLVKLKRAGVGSYFDERLFPGEDPELFSRACRSGLRLAYNPELIIYHKRRDTLYTFLKQFYLYGKVRLLKERIAGTFVPLVNVIPSLFFLYFLAFLGGVWFYWWFAVPVLAYFVIAFVFGFYESCRRQDVSALFVLPFIYFLMHMSYGIGFICGIWHKGRI